MTDTQNNESIGSRARALAGTLPTRKHAFFAFMANEVAEHGAVESEDTIQAPTMNMPAGSPTTQLMRRWEYSDGTVVRYKELGDDYRPNVPAYSIEVKKDRSVPDSIGGPESIAFKVDSEARPSPKNKLDLHNPFTNEAQAKAYEDAAMQSVRFELTR